MANDRQPWTVGTLREVAEFFGVRCDTVRGDWRRTGMPGRKGEWDLRAIQKWKERRERDPVTLAANGASNVQAATAAARALKLKEEHRKLKLQNDILEGQLVYRELVERNASRFAVQIKNRLESIPEQMEMLFPADRRRELSDEVSEHIRAVLTEMSQWDAFDDR